jgi:hypothetical protein
VLGTVHHRMIKTGRRAAMPIVIPPAGLELRTPLVS